MLSGERAPELQARFQDLMARSKNALGLIGVAAIVEQNRVQVSVTRVKDVGDAETVTPSGLPYTREDFGQTRTGDHTVLGAVVSRDPAKGAEGALACGP